MKNAYVGVLFSGFGAKINNTYICTFKYIDPLFIMLLTKKSLRNYFDVSVRKFLAHYKPEILKILKIGETDFNKIKTFNHEQTILLISYYEILKDELL